jgi:hypothetical protein
MRKANILIGFQIKPEEQTSPALSEEHSPDLSQSLSSENESLMKYSQQNDASGFSNYRLAAGKDIYLVDDAVLQQIFLPLT